jgi:uncharacterized protein YndB with AHSA1/START domain
MIAPMTPEADIDIERTIEIAAPADIAFQAILEQIGPASEMPDGTPFPMKIEAWPGGRWYRDLGDNAGHLWGHVQVIKPPKLLEIRGPLFMSYPALNFVQCRLTPEGNTTRLQLTHQAIGLIPQDHREGVVEGWDYELKKIRENAERRAGEARPR